MRLTGCDKDTDLSVQSRLQQNRDRRHTTNSGGQGGNPDGTLDMLTTMDEWSSSQVSPSESSADESGTANTAGGANTTASGSKKKQKRWGKFRPM